MADDFLSTYAPLANDIATRTGLDPATILGVIDTETGHGAHVSGNNIFGISPGGRVAGYPDVQTASNAFISLMQTPRYAGVAAASDPASQSAALVKSGYNTANSNYASIVAAKALQFGKQLGYQDSSGSGGPQNGASINVTSSQPAPDYSGQPTASAPAATPATPAPAAPDYNTPAPAAVPPPTQPPTQDPTAKDRVLADPALNPDGGTPTTAQPPAQGQSAQPQTAKDRVLADPALQPSSSTTSTVPPAPSVGPGGSPEGAPEADAPPWMMQTPLSGSNVANALQPTVNALQPAPNTTYASILPLARDDKTGELRLAMPSLPRELALGTVQGVQGVLTGDVGAQTTVDATGQFHYGMTPGANLLLGAGARPLAFSGANPLLRPPEPTFGGPLPPTADELTAAVRRADQMPPRATADTGGTQTAATPATPAGGQTPTTTFLDNTWLRKAGNVNGQYNMTQGGAAMSSAAQQALDAGGYVRLVTDGGAKQVEITQVKNGMMYDAQGQPWGSAPIAFDGTGNEGLLVTRPATPATPSGGATAGATPQPTGAQVTPTSAAQMTPEEIATQRTVADKQWLNQTQQPGVPDTTEHIPGITPNLVEQEQTVTAARELKALKNLNPELSQAEREILDQNTDLRKGFYADTVGSDVTRAADLKAANDKINTDLAQVWQGKGEADPANVQAQIQTELAGSAGDLPPLKSAMKQVGDSLENAGTDPQAMYRTHRLINYLQSRQGQLENPGYGAADVQAALTRTKGVLAQTIDDAAPGFGKAMSDYSGARGPIDAAKALQDRENGLYDSRGNMSFLKVHGLLRDIIDAQKWDAPNDPLAGVSDAQMTRLKALHDDLKRVASAKDLATAQGSDTAMNAVDIAKAYGKLATRGGIEGAANYAFGPGVGSMIVRGAENLLRPITSGIAARRQITRGMEILQPPPNPLQQNPP